MSNINNFVLLSNVIVNKKFNKLYKFSNFDIPQLCHSDLFVELIETFPIKELKYFFDNVNNN